MGLVFDWTLKASDLVAVAALIIAAMSYRHSVATRRDQKRGTRPVMTVEQAGKIFGEEPPGWRAIKVSLRSRDNDGYRCVSARVSRFSGVNLATMANGGIYKQGRFAWFDGGPADAAHEVPFELKVSHEGVENRYFAGMRMNEGESHHGYLVISVPSSSWLRPSSRRIRISFRIERASDSTSLTVVRELRMIAMARQSEKISRAV